MWDSRKGFTSFLLVSSSRRHGLFFFFQMFDLINSLEIQENSLRCLWSFLLCYQETLVLYFDIKGVQNNTLWLGKRLLRGSSGLSLCVVVVTRNGSWCSRHLFGFFKLRWMYKLFDHYLKALPFFSKFFISLHLRVLDSCMWKMKEEESCPSEFPHSIPHQSWRSLEVMELKLLRTCFTHPQHRKSST